jgi:hypothetical protein
MAHMPRAGTIQASSMAVDKAAKRGTVLWLLQLESSAVQAASEAALSKSS